jgi:hypothetical protein
MRATYPQTVFRFTLVALLLPLQIASQDLRIDVSRRPAAIPKPCLSLVPASLDPVDVAALTKEAICKGDGDMLVNYTYVMNTQQRGKDKKGRIGEESTTYEVFIPVLKGGMRTTGILLVTHRNGFPVPREELEKERLRAGQRLEKEEERLKVKAGAAAPRKASAQITTGLLPVGMYTSTSISSPTHGFRKGGATLAVNDFLRTSKLTFLRRAEREGRESLVFRFDPRPEVEFDVGEKYMARLTGEIWIDTSDRIVTRLVGWPQVSDPANTLPKPKAGAAEPNGGERPPAVSVEMVRLRIGTWLPRELRLNGLDYPTLFDRITYDSTWTYRNYIHFFAEVRDLTADLPKNP